MSCVLDVMEYGCVKSLQSYYRALGLLLTVPVVTDNTNTENNRPQGSTSHPHFQPNSIESMDSWTRQEAGREDK